MVSTNMRTVRHGPRRPCHLAFHAHFPAKPLRGKPSLAQELAWAIHEGVLMDEGPVERETPAPGETPQAGEPSAKEEQLRLL